MIILNIIFDYYLNIPYIDSVDIHLGLLWDWGLGVDLHVCLGRCSRNFSGFEGQGLLGLLRDNLFRLELHLHKSTLLVLGSDFDIFHKTNLEMVFVKFLLVFGDEFFFEKLSWVLNFDE